MATAGPSSGPSHPPPQSSASSATPSSPPNKRDLKSWWRSFKLPSRNHEPQESRVQGIFGVPLRQSIAYANVAISLVDENGQSYIYGYVPIVVAKCGVFLKEKATGVEGIFRLSGSEKRIKELKIAFDSPDRYGKGLVWEGYTVHDAANVLRRYLNDLPEPVVPLDLYEEFREPLRGATKQAVGDADGPQFVENFDEKDAIERYQKLITELPPLNRQLLLYLLDLLAVFAAKSDENRMNSQNLAAIFQPGMLSHPTHDMSPEEYRLNQCVIIFLIENQDHFLIGMQGTGTDEQTRVEIESGTAVGASPLTPSTNRHSGLGRSSSNASAGAHSVRRDGQIRRNRSVTSRHSKGGNDSTPNSPALSATPTNGGLGRSNTVPSKKSPAVAGGKFKKSEQIASSHSPTSLEPLTPAHPETPRISEHSNLAPPMGGTPSHASAAGRSQEKLLGVPHELSTPQKERNLQNFFQRSPTDDGKRPPNKLKKKRIPGSMNHSAQSSNTSLAQPSTVTSPAAEPTNPIDQTIAPEAERSHLQAIQPISEHSTEPTPRQESQGPPVDSHLHPDNDLLKRNMSPPTSVHSGHNDYSDLEYGGGESHTTGSGEPGEKDRKRRWRISRKRDDNGAVSNPGTASSEHAVRTHENADGSTASLGSSAQKPRKSFSGENAEPWLVVGSEQQPSHENGKEGSREGSREGREESKGPIGWIKNKVREAKENAEHRRNKSPPPNHGHSLLPRGKSLDIRREPADKSAQKPVEKSAEKLPEKLVEESAKGAVPTEPSSEKLVEKPTEKSTETPVERLVDPPAEPSVQKPLEPVPEATIPEEPALVSAPAMSVDPPAPELPKQ